MRILRFVPSVRQPLNRPDSMPRCSVPGMCSGQYTGPYLLVPLDKVAEWVPVTRDRARRPGLVTLEQN